MQSTTCSFDTKMILRTGSISPESLVFILFLVFVTVQLVSCTPFTVPEREADETDLPSSFSFQDSASTPLHQWWGIFDDPQLDELIGEALAGNQTLRSFWARLTQARAEARKAGSDLYPSVTGDADASYSKIRSDDGTGSRTSEVERYSLGVFADYEVDLWGRVRASVKSADLEVAASREDLDAAAITITAEVAERWVGIISQRRKLLFLHQQLEANTTYMELIELRFRKSLATALDVMQQKQVVERVKARIPLEELQEQILTNELAVLIGRLPYDVPSVTRQVLPVLASAPAAGIPAQILGNRPDIRAAFHRLEAADQDLVVAKADRLPALRLTGSAAYDSVELDRLFDNWLVNLAAGLTAPLIDGGQRKAQVDLTAARVEEKFALYRQVVLIAVREVEDALIREEKIREHIRQTENQLKSAEIALSEAQFRYTNGLNDYLPVLTQLLSIQNLEIDLIQRRTDLLVARINLYRAIGGTWTDELQPPEPGRTGNNERVKNEER